MTLPSNDRLVLADLHLTPMRELEAELEYLGTTSADLERRLCHDDDRLGQEAVRLFGGRLEYDEDVDLAAWGIMLDRRGELIQAEIARRRALGRKLQGPIYSRIFILDLKARVTLPEFILSMHDSTRLKRFGRRYVGLCPFHAENTASLHVWDDHYHCFGCHEHGDVFDWLMKKAVNTWPEAVEYVAKWVGVALPAQPTPIGKGAI